MICERCGHEQLYGPARFAHGSEQCIANLRADLEAKCDELFRCGKHVIWLEGRVREVGADLEAERARSREQAAVIVALQTDFRDSVLSKRTEMAEERAARAEAQCVAMRAAVEGLRRRSDYFERPGCFCAEWVVSRPSEEHKPACVALTKTLATDAGRDLLTAVRRLCEVARMVLHGDIHEERSYGALDAALADPALSGLEGTGEKMADRHADDKRD